MFFKRLNYILPIMIFTILASMFWRTLEEKNFSGESSLNKNLPKFEAKSLLSGKDINNEVFHGQLTLLQVWASWCKYCRDEHPFIVRLQQNSNLQYIGLNYNDNKVAAKDLLSKFGNPYKYIISDELGQIGIELGVTIIPETLLINKQGEIVARHRGTLTEQDWESEFQPLITSLGGKSWLSKTS